MERDTLLKIVAWERAYKQNGDPHTIIELFQEFIDSGEIQRMGSTYMNMANVLIEHGLCYRPELRVVK